MAISEKNSLKSCDFGACFHKNLLCESHSNFFGDPQVENIHPKKKKFIPTQPK
jgi:hypothetical protein